MLGHDDPEHRRLRGLVDIAFQRRSIEAIGPIITDATDRLLDQMKDLKQTDLMETFCRDLPLSVICVMLGLPDRDHDRFKHWLGGLKDTANIWAVLRAIPGVIKVVSYLRTMARPGSEAKPDGLIAALRDTEVEGRTAFRRRTRLDDLSFIRRRPGDDDTPYLGWAVGNPPARGSAAEAAGRHEPDAIVRRRVPSSRIAGPDDEAALGIARRNARRSPVQARRYGGRILTAANRDPAKFVDPHRFDITRRPNPHLSFGTGVHFCLGFQLARAEAAIAFERILSRYPDIRLAVDPSRVVWRKRVGIRALSSLPVALT